VGNSTCQDSLATLAQNDLRMVCKGSSWARPLLNEKRKLRRASSAIGPKFRSAYSPKSRRSFELRHQRARESRNSTAVAASIVPAGSYVLPVFCWRLPGRRGTAKAYENVPEEPANSLIHRRYRCYRRLQDIFSLVDGLSSAV
jgi:hypothetical protein